MRIYLSGVEKGEGALAATKANVRCVLSSFFYCAWKTNLGRNRSAFEGCLRQAQHRMVDSGAHTFRAAAYGEGGAAAGALDVDVDVFLSEYIKWLVAFNRTGLMDNWVELDIGAMTGKEWVDRHRAKFLEAGLGHGLIQVWHSDEHTWDDWLKLVEEAKRPGRSRFVAIEGHNWVVRNEPLPYEKFLRVAYDAGVKVHVFKMTGIDDLKRWPFFSVDSTSWVIPVRFGNAAVKLRTGGVIQLRQQQPNGQEQRATHRMNVLGTQMSARQRFDVLFKTARAWQDTEAFLTNLWESRGVRWDQVIT